MQHFIKLRQLEQLTPWYAAHLRYRMAMVFGMLTELFYQSGMVSIAVTVVYIYAMFGACVWFSCKHRRQKLPQE